MEVISYLGSLVQFSPARGGRGAADRYRSVWIALPVFRPQCLPHIGVSVLSPSTLLRLPAALYGAGPVLSAVPVFGSSTKVRIRLCLRFVPSPASAVQAARGLGAFSLDVARLFPLRS